MVHGPAQYHFRAHATIPRLESSLRSLMTVPGTFSVIMVLVSFYMGTFTEGSVKISPIFRGGIFIRLHCWNNGTVSL